jgi:hypothetical protein
MYFTEYMADLLDRQTVSVTPPDTLGGSVLKCARTSPQFGQLYWDNATIRVEKQEEPEEKSLIDRIRAKYREVSDIQ